MDTDSFVMMIKTDSFFKDINNDIEKYFDTSNFDKNDNKPLLIGRFKDEIGGKIISAFCALKAKTYAYKLDNDKEVKKAKGTKKCVVKRHITFNDYVDILFSHKKLLKTQFTFKSDNYNIYTQKINKIALNYFDDKRIQVDDKITTYPYGYFDNDIDINFEIKNNTDKLKEIDNSGIIPKNYNTKGTLKKENNTNVTLDFIKSTNANNNYVDSIKSICVYIIKDINIYVDSVKSTYVDTIKSVNANNTYVDRVKSTYLDKIKSIKVIKKDNIIVHCKNNIKSVYSNNITYELNKLIKR